MEELAKLYNPKQTEDKWYSFWQESGFFAAKPDPDKKPFCMVIPPPNVTGILHIGHALNNTIQDILIRYHRMKGEESLWVPGTDHAGIATQNVVEKSIAGEGLKRQDLGREKFAGRVWQWKEQYGSTIIKQLKKLGASCDWNRERFTMDTEYSNSVCEVFVRLYEKGLIYQGSYIINWCPRCQTALSDEEAPHQEVQGNLYYIKYPLKEKIRNKSQIQNPKSQDYIVVATTRPETMLGDTAVAVNPKDKRYKRFIGKTLILPLVNREIKIIADSIVDMKFGTGAVKVTPAHDPDDYSLGKKHNLEFINVMSPDGRMNENAGDYKDMDRFEARKVILQNLKDKGLLEKTESHKLSAGHCYRCRTIIEPYLSKQWFVQMKPLAQPAIQAVKKGRIKFHPPRWEKVYLNWMENIQDWCISRQIWWGHRLPVYYCRKCIEETGSKSEIRNKSEINPKSKIQNPKQNQGIIVSRTKPERCPDCGSADIYQDEDILDTWFSSWLWPFAVFDQQSDLDYFYPTSILVTASEIIFFWVARMIMAGMEFIGEIPFRDVYIHGTVRDIEGKKMSKSLGNIIDPLEIITEYGTDALRFSLISITAQGQDVFLSKERFEQGRNFANKIWNASRFILLSLSKNGSDQGNLEGGVIDNSPDIINRWILSRFYSTLKQVHNSIDNFEFNEAANLLYGFFWHEFCDWYLELVKPILSVGAGPAPARNNVEIILYTVLEEFLRVLHPFMPFVTEEIWQKLPHEGKSIMTQKLPAVQEQFIDKTLEEKIGLALEIITNIRNMRQELDLQVSREIDLIISAGKKEDRELIEAMSGHIKALSKAGSLVIEERYKPAASSITNVIKHLHITILLEGIVDIDKERQKIQERIDKIEAEIDAKEKTLRNKEFIRKAPAEIVHKEKEKLQGLGDTLKKLKNIKNELR